MECRQHSPYKNLEISLKMNKILTYCILLLLLTYSISVFSQAAQNIELEYVVNGKAKKIKNNSKVIFTQDGISSESKVCCNKVLIPKGIVKDKSVDILFVFGKKELFFAAVSTKKLLMDQRVIWELGYYRRFNSKTKEEFYQVKDFSKVKELYYWKFRPQEFGDGTIILVTVPKD